MTILENIVKLGIETIEKNGNLTEFLGRVITTRKLYDDVAGIQNVKIRLYKIEAEREVPISWSEVSANSGGEGFLVCLCILTCLLSYMRRDETDLFTSGEEGKSPDHGQPVCPDKCGASLKTPDRDGKK